MILTITPNPSLDISYFIDNLKIGEANRVKKLIKTAGGKGINVSKVLNQLGSDVLATGFIGGANGIYIKNAMDELNINSNFTTIKGETRLSLTISHDSQITEIREAGPFISKNELDSFLDDLKNINNANVVSCSGSLPIGLGLEFFDLLLEIFNDKKFIIDTSGEMLKYIVLESKNKPYAIKPNIDEIKDILGDIGEDISYSDILKKDIFKNIPIVIISLGKDGAVAKINEKIYTCSVPKIEAVNPVGSGDSSIAGLCYAIDNNMEDEEILKLSMTCGVLNAMEENIGYINVENLNEIKNKIEVEKI